MIIVLKNADFSQSNIGTLSTWRISRSLGTGATYEGATSVDKGAAFSATVTLAEGYEIGTAGVTVTMGGTVLGGAHSISGNVITITIAKVTGNVLIKVPTINTSGGDEPEEPVTPTNYTFTINPDPTSATVTLSATGYSDVSGTGSQSITVANGTEVSWRVEASGYTEQTGTWTANGSNKTENVVLVASGGGEVSNKLPFISGQFIYQDNGVVSSNPDWGYCDTYFEVNEGDTITLDGISETGNMIIYYNSNKDFVSGKSDSLSYTVPSGVSYFRINSFKKYFDTVTVKVNGEYVAVPDVPSSQLTFIEGKYLRTDNGTLATNADWGYCDTYFETSAGTTLTLSGVSATGHSIILYDGSKNYKSGLSGSMSYTVPSGVSYYRISSYKDYFDTISVQ